MPVAFKRFGGMKADVNPHQIPPGNSLLQINVDCVRSGEFRVRGGTRLVTFADPPRPSAPSWSKPAVTQVSLGTSTNASVFSTGFARSRLDIVSFSTVAACTVDKAQWSASRSDTVGFSASAAASTQAGTIEAEAAATASISINATPSATKTVASTFESFTLTGLI